jgi:hypothetical protein
MGQICTCLLSAVFAAVFSGMEQLLTIPKVEFVRCHQCWQEQWTKCLHVEGAYFEVINLPFL